MDKRHKKHIIVGAILLLLLLAAPFIYMDRSNNSSRDERENRELNEDEIRVTGEFSCLPYRETSTAIDESCVLGFLGTDGKIYALDTIDLRSGAADLVEGGEATLVGEFEPVNTSSEEASVFQYDGVLVVHRVE